jgi:putative tricarboxylic transport membrane protein
MNRFSSKVIGASGIGLVTLVFLWEAVKLPFGSESAPGPGFLPVIVAVIVLALCLFNVARGLLSPTPKTTDEIDLWEEDGPSEGPNTLRAVYVMAVLLLYLAVLVPLGFIIATAALLFGILRLLKYRSWWISLVAAIVITGMTYMLFGYWFGIEFPKGVLG